MATAEVHGAESDHRDEGPNASMEGRPLRQDFLASSIEFILK